MNLNFHCTQISLVIKQSNEGFTITITGAHTLPEDASLCYRELERNVAACKTLRELYILLFKTDNDSKEALDIFTRRRLEIDGILPMEESRVAA
jgi:hypothetical protein